MWLKFGVAPDGQLVCVEDVGSGKTELLCPYCYGGLTAKKGKVKQHHFAHSSATCLPVANRDFPILPLYDNFNIYLSRKDLAQLKLLWKEYGSINYPISPGLVTPGLIKAFMFHKNIYLTPPAYEFTNLGKIPVGALEFDLFNQVQEPLLLKKLLKLELAAKHALYKNAADKLYCLTDLTLYRAQFQRILSCNLYFLEIQTHIGTLYKIGVTTRPIQQRLVEIKADLFIPYKTVAIQILGTWPHRGNVELYFKHRYHNYNYRIGSLTEYFKFNPSDANAILSELHSMKAKVLSTGEINILKDNISLSQVAI
ncbi:MULTISPECIES: GIY-YIG nuclease family protein [Nostoc]|uniref:GIY-YIG nuclease family protein n=2 Tax=Nostoc TaxID=1177 RepID=A0ABR8IJW5_9NOSO|nr:MULTISPECIES: GIY-YIG nuclease family protein [Nostoc]MBD2564895.1 GIY-YIG nuclease family protein [Nostoc linckia FACHB-391]MBD2651434.1 GIY-YIG nuclease family protein [Nostoc foliaceum FACHB-393]